MAKTETVATAATTEAAPKKDSRAIILQSVPEKMNHPIDCGDENLKKLASGKVKSQARAEFIREMWGTRHYSRSQIRNMVATFGQDPEVKYQIVFQATKGVEGGPEAKVAAPAEEAAAE